jgi:uncharacterized SAM-binding protein YcdF (DUF218 family)
MFYLSKILSAITQPMFWLAIWWFAALVIISKWRRAAHTMLWSGLFVLFLLGFEAFPNMLLRPLENRFSVPQPHGIASHAGFIVLGGAVEQPKKFHEHGQVPLNGSAERMTIPVSWMRSNIHFELVFSGGEGRMITSGTTEATLAGAFYKEQGLDMQRVRLEDGSRNTRENAQKVATLLGDSCQKNWLLVTSASHMPRSMEEFNAVGCHVTPYPVDFQTSSTTAWTEYSLANSLMRWQVALHEWLGLAVYAFTR